MGIQQGSTVVSPTKDQGCGKRLYAMPLIYWGRVTHLCVSKITSIGSDNGLSPGRRQAIFWTTTGILLIWPWGTNFSETFIEIHTFLFKKIYLKLSSAKVAAISSRGDELMCGELWYSQFGSNWTTRLPRPFWYNASSIQTPQAIVWLRTLIWYRSIRWSTYCEISNKNTKHRNTTVFDIPHVSVCNGLYSIL